ncbi:MAG TPA: ribulose-phosphate 3-epimerase [Gaiellaceae bacterium]|jgi:ribulose-phosphate 3-epimerase
MPWSEWARAIEIEPSLYAADFARLGDQIEQLLAAGTRVFHYDVGDGHFVEPITIGPIVLESIAPIVHAGGGALDCHLMVDEPAKHIPQIAAAGGDSVTFHLEVAEDVRGLVELARSHGLGAGLAFNPETTVEQALAGAEGVDLVLCMSIHPGYSGQEFMSEAFERIAALRAGLPPEIHVQVDGGVKPENVGEVHRAGADLLVVGSGVFTGGDIGAAYRELATDAVAAA